MKSLSILNQGSASRDARSTLGFFVLVSLVLNGLGLFATLLLFGTYVGLARKAPPTLVQLEAGKTIAVQPLDSKERTPATIQRFTQETLSLLMSASGRIPSADPKVQPLADPGIEVGGNKKITTLAKLAGFALSEDFRPDFLTKLGQLTPQDLFNGATTTQTVLVVRDVSVPEKVGDGQWKLVMVADLIRVSQTNQIGAGMPFNKEIFIRSVLQPAVTSVASDLERQVADTRKAGLEIYGMREFVPPNL